MSTSNFAERVTRAGRQHFGFSESQVRHHPLYASMSENAARHDAQSAYTGAVEAAITAAAIELGLDPAQCHSHGPARTRAIVRASERHPEVFRT